MQTKTHDNQTQALQAQKLTTVKRTVRLDLDVNQKLEEVATKQRTTLNSLLNKALRKYVDWEVFAESFGLITVDRRVWKALLTRLTELEAKELGHGAGAQSIMDFVMYYYHKFDLESVIRAFQLLGAEYMRNFQFVDFAADGKTRTVVMRHSMGASASAFYGEALRTLCERSKISAEIQESDEHINVRFMHIPEEDQIC